MDLNFLGRGGAFNTKELNTSAYFISGKELFLIDCGETVFYVLQKNNLLKNIKTINLMITHTHSDHVGSIGTLASYAFRKLDTPLNIILPTNAKYKDDIINILKGFGCASKKYRFINEKELDNKNDSFIKVRFTKTKHSKYIDCYSIIITTKKGIVFYSGDTSEINTLNKIIKTEEKIDKIYIDTTSKDYEGNKHLYIGIIEKNIPENLKKKVYCMHINDDECINMIKKAGFNLVKVKGIK